MNEARRLSTRGRVFAVAAVLVGGAFGLAAVGIVLLRNGRKRLGGAFLGIGLLGSVAGLVLWTSSKPYRIPSESGLPTFEIGDRVFSSKDGEAKLGETAIFRPPVGAEIQTCGAPQKAGAVCARPTLDRADVTFIKRVVAVGGDTVALKGGRLIRNGKLVDEPYIRPCGADALSEGCDFPTPVRIPRDHLFVLGDNRGASDDSRFWGPIPTSSVIGHVTFRYWPLSRLGRP